MDEVKLLPCPFCAVSDCLTMPDQAARKWVQCNNIDCQAEGPVADTREKAIELWNTRPTLVTDELVARQFHETYERLAPQFSYETRKASAVPWEQVPENNRKLMIAVVGEVRSAIAAMPAIPPQSLGDDV